MRRRYKTNWTLKATVVFGTLMTLMSLVGWLETGDIFSALEGWLIGFVGYSIIIFLDYFFTYLEVDVC
jgi:hypothetical protein